jgi:toluene monooxygenase system protein E
VSASVGADDGVGPVLQATPFARAVVSVHFPLRFPVHGLQMLASYVAQMAPASRITNCAAFQPADEMRRVQRIAYRTVQLSGPAFDADTPRRQQAAWEEEAAFQPLRELVEKALITYDWGEAFLVTTAVIKPRIDRLVNQEIAGMLAIRRSRACSQRRTATRS